MGKLVHRGEVSHDETDSGVALRKMLTGEETIIKLTGVVAFFILGA